MTIREMQSLGGKSRAKVLSAERRREIAIAGGRARWRGHVRVVRVREPVGEKLRRLSNEWWVVAKGAGYHLETVRVLVNHLVDHWKG